MLSKHYYLLMRKLFTLTIVFFAFNYNNARAQLVTDTVIAKTIKQFVGMGYNHEHTYTPLVQHAGVIPDQLLACYGGKEVLVAAIYSTEPLKPFARIVVQKKYNGKTEYDKYQFQPVAFDEQLHIYYSLISILFPEEAKFKNCHANVQVYDEKMQAKQVWLLVFTK